MPRLRTLAAAVSAAVLALSPMTATPSDASPTATSAAITSAAAALAPTPPMGWNDWAHYECNFNEQVVTSNADALISTGLAAKGYNTVTIDDCWMSHSRSNGHLVADSTKFPHGMAWLGSYLHSRGLKFGIYEDAGTSTCGGYPGSAGHFATDANDFASWGVDYLKLDGCNVPVPSGKTKEQAYRDAYSSMSSALSASGRPIVFSESAPAYFQGTSDWYTVLGWVGQYGQLWREGADIAVYNGNSSRWSSVLYNYGYNRGLGRYESPGNWNDPDFLIAGDGGLTADESRSQVALWAMMASPMILSSNISQLTSAGLAALGNTDLIALDQDSLGRQADVISSSSSTDVLARSLANGDHAAAVLNRTSSTRTVSVPLSSIGLGGCTVTAKDLWTGATSTTSDSLTASVPAHGTAVWRLSGCGTGGGCSVSGQKLTNPGFESGGTAWSATPGVIGQYGSNEPTHSGTWDAWLDGYGTTHTDTLSQSVTIPPGCHAGLSFYLHTDTADTSTTTDHDTLTVKVGSTTVATFSNRDAASGYQQHTYDVSSLAGQTVTLLFTGTEDASLQTSFVVDDATLTLN